MFQIPINALKQTEGHFNELEIASTPLAHRHRTGIQFIENEMIRGLSTQDF